MTCLRPLGRREARVLIIWTLDVGGAEGQLVKLASGLNRARLEPRVVCLSEAGPYRDVLEAAGVRVDVGVFRGTGCSGIRDRLRCSPAVKPMSARGENVPLVGV